MATPNPLDSIISLAKRRGFVYQAGEIYGGSRSAWDYGPLGTALNLSGQSLVVGYGNGYTLGHCTMADVTVTLVGTVPTPGAAAALGLAGLAGLRRRRA